MKIIPLERSGVEVLSFEVGKVRTFEENINDRRSFRESDGTVTKRTFLNA